VTKQDRKKKGKNKKKRVIATYRILLQLSKTGVAVNTEIWSKKKKQSIIRKREDRHNEKSW